MFEEQEPKGSQPRALGALGSLVHQRSSWYSLGMLSEGSLRERGVLWRPLPKEREECPRGSRGEGGLGFGGIF